MKRKLLILIVMMLPLMAMSQGVITRPGKKPAKTAPKQSAPTKKRNSLPALHRRLMAVNPLR